MQETGVVQLITKTENNFLRDKNIQEIDEQLFFSIDERSGTIDLSELGREKLSSANPEQFVIPDIGELFHDIDNNSNLSSTDKLAEKEKIQSVHAERSEVIHTINQLLRAYSLMQKDVDYIVKEQKVQIVDEHTGRVMPGRRFSSGLHAAIEAKEKVKIERESQTMAQITVQNYFRMYEKLAGMTGTAITEANEFMQIYSLDVVEIDTNRPITRQDHDDMIYKTKREKYSACIEKIKELKIKGQPILVGTTSVEESETLSRMLRRSKVSHNVLNAKQHQKEAEIIQRAGHKSSITIATNMAGRGTDIKLDKESKDLGGLFILGTGRHESRRIDLQLRGRSGRQGDAGESIFYLSLEDDLMRLFGSESIDTIMKKFGLKEGESIDHPWINTALERAQKRVEGRNFDIRKTLLKFDDVMNDQRKVIFEQRKEILKSNNINEIINSFVEDLTNNFVKERKIYERENQLDSFKIKIKPVLGKTFSDDEIENILHLKDSEFENIIKEKFNEFRKKRNDLLNEKTNHELEKRIFLQNIDLLWRSHLQYLEHLRQVVGLRGYAQKDPLDEFRRDAFKLFENLLNKIKIDFITFLNNLQIVPNSVSSQNNINNKEKDIKNNPKFPSKKMKRNEPCFCGSGKKYKHCHGSL